MTTRTEKRNVGPLDMRAVISSINVEKRTFDVMFSTGAKVLRSSWYDGQFYEELSMDPKSIRMGRLTSGTAPLLMNHDSYDVADVPGVIESARIEGGKGYATVRMVSEGIDPEADKLFRKIADKVVTNVSVGYRTWAVEKTEGVDTKIPTLRATDWEPYEISMVAMGAEQGAGVRSAEHTQTHEVEITTRGAPPTHHEDRTMTPEEIKALQDKQASEARALELKTAADLAVKVDRERAAGIMHAVRAAKLDDGKLGEKMIADGVTLDAARALVLNELASRDLAEAPTSHTRVTGVEGGDERDKFVRGVSAWAFEAAGNGLVSLAKKRGIDGFKDIETDGAHFRGMKISDIARACCERSGISTKGIYDGNKLVEMASRASTGDFAVLFENIMYKTMRAGYAVQEDTWRRWVGTATVKDFRAANLYMKGAFSGALPVVPEDGEFPFRSLPDGSKVQISTETRGQRISLSRQAIINDDMGALVGIAADFGRQAGKSIEIACYDMLALNVNLGPSMSDAAPFYNDAARANVSTTAALSVAALDADKLKFREQTFGDDYLDLRPSILLVPPGLESAAKIINASAFDHTTGSNNQVPNPVQGLFADIVSSPRLVSSTRRFLFTAEKEAFKVVFLEGTGEGPVMESRQGFERDGLEWKARIDFKVNPFDPRTSITNAG